MIRLSENCNMLVFEEVLGPDRDHQKARNTSVPVDLNRWMVHAILLTPLESFWYEAL